MAQNTLEIIIKASAGKAIGEIKKLDGEIDKIGKTSKVSFLGMASSTLAAVGGVAAIG